MSDDSWGAYCYHEHLYNFMFDNIEPSDDNFLNFEVNGSTMVGFPGNGMCTYVDWIAITYPLLPVIKWATSGNEFAMTCGYYVEYEWTGYEGESVDF